jgi:hypothetical protein
MIEFAFTSASHTPMNEPVHSTTLSTADLPVLSGN